jgi:hypothetical protein
MDEACRAAAGQSSSASPASLRLSQRTRTPTDRHEPVESIKDHTVEAAEAAAQRAQQAAEAQIVRNRTGLSSEFTVLDLNEASAEPVTG